MSIISILFCIFLFFILRALFRGFVFFRRINNANKAYGKAYEDFMRNQQPPRPEPPAHKKVITKDMGEYVAYEEISVEQSQTTTTDGSTSYTTEEQIVDAEWVEIKP